MADIILVLNAGSSSIKFRAFGGQGTTLDLVLRGQVDGLNTAPRFTAVDSAGQKTGAPVSNWVTRARSSTSARFCTVTAKAIG
jgi:acetate kinase